MKNKTVVALSLGLILGMSLGAVENSPIGIQTISSLVPGTHAMVEVEIKAVLDYDELRVKDATGSIEVYLGERPPRSLRFFVGQKIVVEGWVDDDSPALREIYAERITFGDGSTIYLEAFGD